MAAAANTLNHDFRIALACLEITCFVMVATLSKAALGLLGFFVATGVVIGLGLLWLLSSWGDDEVPLD